MMTRRIRSLTLHVSYPAGKILRGKRLLADSTLM